MGTACCKSAADSDDAWQSGELCTTGTRARALRSKRVTAAEAGDGSGGGGGGGDDGGGDDGGGDDGGGNDDDG